jgi:hypothetical protein
LSRAAARSGWTRPWPLTSRASWRRRAQDPRARRRCRAARREREPRRGTGWIASGSRTGGEAGRRDGTVADWTVATPRRPVGPPRTDRPRSRPFTA